MLIFAGVIPLRTGPDDHEDEKSCARGSPEPLGRNVARSGADDRTAASTSRIGDPGAAGGRATCPSSACASSGTSPICSNCSCNSRASRRARRSGTVSGSSSGSCSNGRARARRSRHILAGSHGHAAAARKAGCWPPHGRHVHCCCPVACDRDWRGSLRSGSRRDWNRDRHRLQL
jgi:hypothetical protein